MCGEELDILPPSPHTTHPHAVSVRYASLLHTYYYFHSFLFFFNSFIVWRKRRFGKEAGGGGEIGLNSERKSAGAIKRMAFVLATP